LFEFESRLFGLKHISKPSTSLSKELCLSSQEF
jgi:hypothetical protein